MGARTVPVEELTAENTEVRGFNGRATVNCGFSLPIVRHQPTGLYCALSVTRTPGPVWSTEEEIREFEASGRVTLLSDTERLEAASGAHQVTYAPEAILLPNDWNVVPRKQPVLNGIKEGVSRFHQMVCVFRSPDNSNIILICSCLYVS